MSGLDTSALAHFGDDTKLVLAGRDPFAAHGFVNPPVYHASTVLFKNVKEMQAPTGYVYARRGTPTSDALEKALTAIEGGKGVVVCPSGLAAVSAALLSCVKAGGHLLVADSVYQPTRHFCDGILARMGVETTYYDPLIGAGIEALIKPNTQAIYTESPGSQSFEIQDIPAITAVARRRDILTLMDNTWATALLFPAHEHGIDLVIEAGTKYLIGHSDAMMGIVSASEKAWGALKAAHGDMGLCVGPDDMFLALRGLRTMGIRLKHHEASALYIARWLAGRPEVARVLHPALESHPGHAIWKRDFKGSSGLFSVVMQPAPAAAVAAFLDDLELFGLGFSWGGYESLAIPFNCAGYRTATQWQPGGPCIRFHIGLENVDDLIKDLEAGLDRFHAHR